MTAPGATSDEPVATPRSTSVSRAGASALWRDVAGGAAADPGFAWALVIGIALIGLGLLGFVPNPLVGAPSVAWGMPLLLTGDAHDVLHLVGGAVALHAALGMSRQHRDATLIGLGAAALILLALGLLDGRWLGIAPYPVGLVDQLLHLVVGVGSLVMGLAGSGAVNVPIVTGAFRRADLAAAGAGALAVASAEPEPAADLEAPDPAEPAEPAADLEAPDPAEPAEPADAEPAEPVEPAEPDEAAEGADEPAGAAEPDEPAEPAEPDEAAEGADEPADAAEPAEPAEPDEPADAAEPAEPAAEPAEAPERAAEPADAADEPADAAEPAEAPEPAQAPEPADAATPQQPGEPDHTA